MKLYIEKDFQQQRVKFWLVKDKEHPKVYLGHDKGVLTEFSPIDMDVKPFLELEYSLADDFIKLIAEYANSNNIKTEQRSFIEGELIEACRYGYNYHKTSQFPEMEFDDMAINNFKQHLQAGLLSPSTETDKSEAVEFAEWVGRNIKNLGLRKPVEPVEKRTVVRSKKQELSHGQKRKSKTK